MARVSLAFSYVSALECYAVCVCVFTDRCVGHDGICLQGLHVTNPEQTVPQHGATAAC